VCDIFDTTESLQLIGALTEGIQIMDWRVKASEKTFYFPVQQWSAAEFWLNEPKPKRVKEYANPKAMWHKKRIVGWEEPGYCSLYSKCFRTVTLFHLSVTIISSMVCATDGTADLILVILLTFIVRSPITF